MNKYYLSVLLALMVFCLPDSGSAQVTVASPDGRIKAEVILGNKIYYTVSYDDETILEASPLSLTINEQIKGEKPKLLRSKSSFTEQKLYPVWGSQKEIDDRYNNLLLEFEGGYSVEFRAYDNGLAYRFITSMKEKEVIVNDEEVAYRFGFGTEAWISTDQTYETNYRKTSLDVEKITNFNKKLNKIYLPIVIQASSKVKMVITEADLHDYPSLFLNRGNDYENFLLGTFERYALTTKTGGFSNYSKIADKQADYLAKTTGTRTYPWRIMVISDDDRDFVNNDLVFQLSSPSSLGNTEWIKPGKVAWEWWHDYVVEGENFKGGVNTQTYLYHIDFAAKYGLEYIIIDWLWTDKYDLTLFNPEVDLKKIVSYGKSKNVSVILWCPGHTLHSQSEEALDLFASYGAAGVKADFFGREDQTGINMYEDIAKAAAKRHLLVDFHGCTKPTGLSRTYPNIINYEAVAGNEYNKLSVDKITVAHKVIIPFTRGIQGPMDYTPGGMRNLQSGHNLRFTLPQVHGTRCNEAALFVIYNEPLKMMCDAPSVYEREPAFTQFIGGIPTSWDESLVLEASLGEYVVEARRTGNVWYLAGITGDSPKDLDLDLSFLDGAKYKVTSLVDGPNADRVGTDYLLTEQTQNKLNSVKVKMVNGGGFIMKLEPVN